jgi:hypothetical protein
MSILPEPFADLEGFAADWAKETFKERYAQRMASTQADLQTFFDAVYPRMDDMVAYLDQYPVGELPADARALYCIACALMDVAPAVEIFKQPTVPLGMEWWKPVVTEYRTALLK